MDGRVVAHQRIVLHYQHQPGPRRCPFAIISSVQLVLTAVQFRQQILEDIFGRERVVGQVTVSGFVAQRVGVRQPLEPLPLGRPIGRVDGQEMDFVGRMMDDQVADQGACYTGTLGQRAGDPQRPRVDVGCHRHLGDCDVLGLQGEGLCQTGIWHVWMGR